MGVLGKAKEAANEVVGNYLTKQERAHIYKQKLPLYIHAIKQRVGKYGDSVDVTFSMGDAKGEQKVMSFTLNPYREVFFAELSDQLSEGPIGPVKLDKVTTANGEAWDIGEFD